MEFVGPDADVVCALIVCPVGAAKHGRRDVGVSFSERTLRLRRTAQLDPSRGRDTVRRVIDDLLLLITLS